LKKQQAQAKSRNNSIIKQDKQGYQKREISMMVKKI
jgi:hypothetical protein